MKSFSRFDDSEQNDIAVIPFWEHVTSQAADRMQNSGICLTVDSNLQPMVVQGNLMALDKIIACVLHNAIDAVKETTFPCIDLEAATMERTLNAELKAPFFGASALTRRNVVATMKKVITLTMD